MLRFLGEELRARDFRAPVFAPGSIVHLTWKGEDAARIALSARLKDGGKVYEWSLQLFREGYPGFLIPGRCIGVLSVR